MDELFQALKQLTLTVKKMIEESISKGTLKPREEEYFRWKVEKFQYTDKGVTESSAHGQYFTKQSWFRTTEKIEESIKQHSGYASALEHLTDVFGKSDKLSLDLEYFIGKLIHQYLYNLKIEEKDIDSLITAFLKDLREEPVKYGAKVELQGVALQLEKIEPSFGMILRQTKIEDIEREFPVYRFFMMPQHLPNPSAILTIEFLGRGSNEIQKRVEQAIAILRLFKVGSVEWTTYRTTSESVTDIEASGATSYRRMGAPLETYLITQEETQKLKKFWRTMSDSIPGSFFWADATGTNYLTIAYKRYSDALLENGLLERRIANAVMGLEALFLKAGETQELPYRLRVRSGKLFSLLGYNPHEITKIINDAYKVRNLFAHGGQLSCKAKKKLGSKYKDVRNLLSSVLDYLRTSIIAMILSNREKDEFIDLVDDSLIDRKQEEQLNGIISQAKEVIR